MTAGNSRALWWRPPTRAAWRVQQAALARVKWLREDARRMDSTTGGLIWIWPTSKNKQSTSAAVHRDQRNGRQRIAQRRRKRCDMEKGIGKAQKREQERNNKEQQMEQRPRDETDRRAQDCCFLAVFSLLCLLQKSCLFACCSPRASGEVRWPQTWRSVRSLQPTSAGQMRGWGREGARVGRQVSVLG
jgi:hypothetical protein